MFVSIKFLIPTSKELPIKISYKQSHIFEAIKPSIPYLEYTAPRPETQSSIHAAKNTVRVMIVENQAYWINNNSVFVAEVVNGSVDQENAKQVDTMNMNKVELDQLSFIISKLTEGNSSDSGNPRFS